MSAFDDDPAVCHCRRDGIGPHWHDGSACPPEPTPAPQPCGHGRRDFCSTCFERLCPCLKGRPCAFDENGVFHPPAPPRVSLAELIGSLFHADGPVKKRRERLQQIYREEAEKAGGPPYLGPYISPVIGSAPHWWGPPLTPDEERPDSLAADMAADADIYDTEDKTVDYEWDGAEDEIAPYPTTLNHNDPFERVLVDIVETNRRKRRDYAEDGSPFSNFDYTADSLGLDGFTAVESAVFNINQKLARLRSLRLNGRINDTANESVADTYLDLAVYGVIALAIHRYPEGEVA